MKKREKNQEKKIKKRTQKKKIYFKDQEKNFKIFIKKIEEEEEGDKGSPRF